MKTSHVVPSLISHGNPQYQRKLRSAEKTLGVERDATFRVARTAYKKLALKFHPDKHPKDLTPEQKDAASKRWVQIGEAYETFSKVPLGSKHTPWNGRKRKRYMAISCMHRYANKSFEELLFEDLFNRPSSQYAIVPAGATGGGILTVDVGLATVDAALLGRALSNGDHQEELIWGDENDCDYENDYDDSDDSGMETSSSVDSESDDDMSDDDMSERDRLIEFDQMTDFTLNKILEHPRQNETNHIMVASKTARSFLLDLVPDHEFFRQKASSANRAILDALEFFTKEVPRQLSDQQAVRMVKPTIFDGHQPDVTPEQKRTKIREKLTRFAADLGVPNFDMALAERHFETYSAKFPDVERGVVASSTETHACSTGISICANSTHDRETLECTLVHEFLHYYTKPAADRLRKELEEICQPLPDDPETLFLRLNEGVIQCLTKYVCKEQEIQYNPTNEEFVEWIEETLIPANWEWKVVRQLRCWIFEPDSVWLMRGLREARLLPGVQIDCNNERANNASANNTASGILMSSPMNNTIPGQNQSQSSSSSRQPEREAKNPGPAATMSSTPTTDRHQSHSSSSSQRPAKAKKSDSDHGSDDDSSGDSGRSPRPPLPSEKKTKKSVEKKRKGRRASTRGNI